VNTVPGAVFTTLDFLRNLQNGPTKIEYYITLRWKELQDKNAIAYERLL